MTTAAEAPVGNSRKPCTGPYRGAPSRESEPGPSVRERPFLGFVAASALVVFGAIGGLMVREGTHHKTYGGARTQVVMRPAVVYPVDVAWCSATFPCGCPASDPDECEHCCVHPDPFEYCCRLPFPIGGDCN